MVQMQPCALALDVDCRDTLCVLTIMDTSGAEGDNEGHASLNY